MSKEYFDKLFIESHGESKSFGSDVTYVLGADFIGERAVEDWGCGLGWFRRFAKGPYKGIDGSWSPYADEVKDLREYTSQTPAIFMRHVLEYNPTDWETIVDNAVSSFTERMMLITSHFGLPAPAKIGKRFSDCRWSYETIGAASVFSVERS